MTWRKSTKWVETDFGSTQKMLVKVATGPGFYKVWVTVPSSIDPQRGDSVRLTATLSRSRDDEAFAFGSRPTGATCTPAS